MPGLCIPKSEMEKLKKAFRGGDISIERLYDMTDVERNALFSNYLSKESAHLVNTNFERAILSNQKNAFTKFVEKTFSPKQQDLRSAFIKKLEKIDKVMNQEEVDDFLGDLANTKLGMQDVSEAEIKTMLDMKKNFEELESRIPADALDDSAESMAYGYARLQFNKFVGKLKEQTTPLTAKEIAMQKLTYPGEIIIDIGNTLKSAIATLDNSYWLRQGIKEFLTPWTGGTKRWVTAFIKSWRDMGKQLFAKAEKKGWKGIWSKPNDAIMDAIHAQILGSKNARNGKYAAAKNGYGLGVLGEEQYPSTIIERVPGIGRLFKASEVAFNGGALRARKALADAEIARAERNGIDVMDKAEASAIGELIGNMTGRAELGKLGTHAKEVNALVFSIRFLKSNFKTLLSPIELGMSYVQGNPVGRYAKKRAAENLVQIVTSVAAIGTIANILHPGSFESNPDSTNFGRIKINGIWHDITGGMGSIVTLASRMIPDSRGHFYVVSSNGTKTELYKGYKPSTILSIAEDFLLGKVSPAAGVARDLANQRDYQGRKPTIETIVTGAVTPFTIQLEEKLKHRDFADNLLTLILDGIGSGANVPAPKKK